MQVRHDIHAYLFIWISGCLVYLSVCLSICCLVYLFVCLCMFVPLYSPTNPYPLQSINQSTTYMYAAELDRIGFAWSASEARMNHSFSNFCLALETYQDLYGGGMPHKGMPPGKCIPPSKFVVPSEAPWAKQIQGYRLGRKIGEIRRGVVFDSLAYRERLGALGLLPDEYQNEVKQRKFLLFCKCLLQYNKLRGDMSVSVCLWGKGDCSMELGCNWALSDSLRSPGLALSSIIFPVPYHVSITLTITFLSL